MSKKRKTKREKIVSQERRAHLITQASEVETTYSFESTTVTIPPTKNSQQQITTGYTYVASDIKKSLFVTSLILFASIILFTLIQVNILSISELGY